MARPDGFDMNRLDAFERDCEEDGDCSEVGVWLHEGASDEE